jgi:hypothetical protein
VPDEQFIAASKSPTTWPLSSRRTCTSRNTRCPARCAEGIEPNVKRIKHRGARPTRITLCASRAPSPLGHDRCGIGFNTSARRNGEEGAALDSDAVCPPIVR